MIRRISAILILLASFSAGLYAQSTPNQGKGSNPSATSVSTVNQGGTLVRKRTASDDAAGLSVENNRVSAKPAEAGAKGESKQSALTPVESKAPVQNEAPEGDLKK